MDVLKMLYMHKIHLFLHRMICTIAHINSNVLSEITEILSRLFHLYDFGIRVTNDLSIPRR